MMLCMTNAIQVETSDQPGNELLKGETFAKWHMDVFRLVVYVTV